jgi:hypothetical protein
MVATRLQYDFMATMCECQCAHIECQQITYNLQQNHVEPHILEVSPIGGPLVMFTGGSELEPWCMVFRLVKPLVS